MSNQDPIFNFTSYLCSPDGCKVILWKRTTAVPSRGSFLASGAAMGSTGEGHHQKWGWMSRNKSCFKVDSDTQISMGGQQSLLDQKKKEKNPPERQQSLWLFWCQLWLQSSSVFHSSITDIQKEWLPWKAWRKSKLFSCSFDLLYFLFSEALMQLNPKGVIMHNAHHFTEWKQTCETIVSRLFMN